MIPQLGLPEMIVVMGVAVLLFGSRLPEVGRSLGKGLIEFKKGLRGIEEGLDLSSLGNPSSSSSHSSSRYDDKPRSSGSDYVEPSAPKFQPASVPRMEYQPPQD